ncbi:hypothetical protein AFCA_009283 [Aspergillus flavus]|nr:hypothetical protein AFCA_009283 [Aspergillus flavus]
MDIWFSNAKFSSELLENPKGFKFATGRNLLRLFPSPAVLNPLLLLFVAPNCHSVHLSLVGSGIVTKSKTSPASVCVDLILLAR